MNRTQLAVLKDTGNKALYCLLDCEEGICLYSDEHCMFKEIADFSLERSSWNEKGSLLLVSLDFSEGDCAWSESVRFLIFYATFGKGCLLLGKLVLACFRPRCHVQLIWFDLVYTGYFLSWHFKFI